MTDSNFALYFRAKNRDRSCFVFEPDKYIATELYRAIHLT